jgi:hypothetical protein
MQFGLILLLVEVALIVHAAKTGRFLPWGLIIFFIPGFGAIAYVLVELVPEWFGSVQGQQARRRVVNTLDPGKRYRVLSDQLEVTDTIANRAALAEECLALGKFDEALRHYEHILALPMGDDAIYALGKARAQFGLEQPQEVVATLDDLRERWPDYQSAEGHLLYARALEESGRTEDALSEYQAVANYYPGAEARVRYGLLLAKAGQQAEAKNGAFRGLGPAQARAQIREARAGGMDRGCRRRVAGSSAGLNKPMMLEVRIASVTSMVTGRADA